MLSFRVGLWDEEEVEREEGVVDLVIASNSFTTPSCPFLVAYDSGV